MVEKIYKCRDNISQVVCSVNDLLYDFFYNICPLSLRSASRSVPHRSPPGSGSSVKKAGFRRSLCMQTADWDVVLSESDALGW